MATSGEVRRAPIPVSGSDDEGDVVSGPPTYIDEAAPLSRANPVNGMSVDVEEHFQVSAFANTIDRAQWDSMPSRVSQNMERIFRLFDDTDTKATFFTLGCVAEKVPNLIRTMVAEGHEVASHGYDHTRVWTQTPKAFFEDVSRTKKMLEDISGERVTGYRAPSFSITERTAWAHDELQKAGYQYSSSIYPINHDHYGLPSAPRFPFRLKEGGILEAPLTTAKAAGRNWPGAGGGYFRLLPLTYSRWALRQVNHHERMPAFFYFHPWEIDPDQPRVSGIPLRARFRHYVNLSRFERRLASMLADFSWGRMDHILHHAIAPN